MKTFYQTMKFEKDAQKKAKELEAKFGVKFDYYGTMGGYKFNAYTTKDTAESKNAAEWIMGYLPKVNKVVAVNTQFVSIVKVAEMSKLTIATVASGFAWLINHKMVKVEIDRMGKPAYIALWE